MSSRGGFGIDPPAGRTGDSRDPTPTRDPDPVQDPDVPPKRYEVVVDQILDIIWTAWDDRVCPICAPYNGRVYPQFYGAFPPFHPNCRCRRVWFITTYKGRWV